MLKAGWVILWYSEKYWIRSGFTENLSFYHKVLDGQREEELLTLSVFSQDVADTCKVYCYYRIDVCYLQELLNIERVGKCSSLKTSDLFP